MADATRVFFIEHQAANLAAYIGAMKKRPEVDEQLAQLEDALANAVHSL